MSLETSFGLAEKAAYRSKYFVYYFFIRTGVF